jgi:hypothetical protein
MAHSEMRAGTLPSLATGHGVVIGDTPRQVQRKIGKPTRTRRTGRKWQQRIDTYSARIRDRRGPWQYQAVYTYRKGRLWAVELTLHSRGEG